MFSSLEALFSQNEITPEVDRLILKLQKDPSISRKEKLNKLWNLALNHRAEPVKFGYLLDALGFMYPIELEDALMQEYQQNSDVDERLKLLSAMWQGALVPPGQSLTVQDKQAIRALQVFLKNQIEAEKNPRLLDLLIYTYANFTPGKEADNLISQKLKWIQMNDPSLMPPDESFRVKIRHALMTQDSQKEIFHILLSENKTDPNFSKALCQVLPEYPKGSLDPEVLSTANQLLSQMKQAMPPAGRSARYQKLWLRLHPCG